MLCPAPPLPVQFTEKRPFCLPHVCSWHQRYQLGAVSQQMPNPSPVACHLFLWAEFSYSVSSLRVLYVPATGRSTASPRSRFGLACNTHSLLTLLLNHAALGERQQLPVPQESGRKAAFLFPRFVCSVCVLNSLLYGLSVVSQSLARKSSFTLAGDASTHYSVVPWPPSTPRAMSCVS